MALHGEVAVNDSVIFFWSARRLTPLEPVGELATQEHEYEISFQAYDNNQIIRKSDLVRHTYGDGAAVLAGKVMEIADRILPLTTPTQLWSSL